jgi:hypothetical protein
MATIFITYFVKSLAGYNVSLPCSSITTLMKVDDFLCEPYLVKIWQPLFWHSWCGTRYILFWGWQLFSFHAATGLQFSSPPHPHRPPTFGRILVDAGLERHATANEEQIYQRYWQNFDTARIGIRDFTSLRTNSLQFW